MLKVTNLHFEYPTKVALHNVSFEISPKTVTALVGPNGAGKTTLLRCIAGLEKPFSGNILLNGINVIEDPKNAHKEIGYLSDFFGVYESLTINQCLTFAARIRGIDESEVPKKVQATAEMLEISDRMNERAGELSRGLRQRLGIAQSIIHSPKLLILDEPASGLDPEARISLSSLMLELKDRGITLIVSSHILSELEDYSTAMLIMRGGKIIGKEKLGRAGHKEEISNIRIRLIGSGSAALKKIISKNEDCKNLKIDSGTATFSFSANEKKRAALLKSIVGKVNITEFSAQEKSMQDLYMDVAAEEKKRNEVEC